MFATYIHRAWYKALREQILIYHTLCVLLQEHDESKMRMSLQAFLTDLYIHAVIRGGFMYTSTQRIAPAYKNGQGAIENAVRLTPTCS